MIQLSHCFQVPARAHGHRVLWKEVTRSESAPDAPLQPVAAQHTPPGLLGPRDRGEQPDVTGEEGVGREGGHPGRLSGLGESVTRSSLNVYPGFRYRLLVSVVTHEQMKEFEGLYILTHTCYPDVFPTRCFSGFAGTVT